MNGELKHIFDESVCLSSRQLKDYVSGHMANEECHAVEHHLNGCPLCSAAIDGMLLDPEKSLATITEMNTDFLKEHFILKNPQVQLNAVTPAAPVMDTPNRPGAKMQPFWRTAAAAAVIFTAICLFWYVRSVQKSDKDAIIAQKFDDEKNAKPAAAQKAVLTEAPKPQAEEATVAAAEPAAAAAPPETQAPVQKDVAAASGAAQQAQNGANTAKSTADAKKALDELSKTPLLAAKAPVDNKKAPAEKPKTIADVKKPDPNAAKVAAGGPNTKAPAKDERRPAVEMLAAKDDKTNKNRAVPEAAAAVHSTGQSAPPPAVAHTEAAAAAPNTEGAGKAADQLPADKLDRGKYYFNNQKWNDALGEYKSEINNASKSKRHEATYMAAQCYVKLGNNKEAERLLKIIVDEGGSEKRRAKKLLESIGKQ